MAKDYRREVAQMTMQQTESGEPVERITYSLTDVCDSIAADYPEHSQLLRRASSLFALPAEVIQAAVERTTSLDPEIDLMGLEDDICDLNFTAAAMFVDKLEKETSPFCDQCRDGIFGGAHRGICDCGREMTGWGERWHCRVCAVRNGKCMNCGADI